MVEWIKQKIGYQESKMKYGSRQNKLGIGKITEEKDKENVSLKN